MYSKSTSWTVEHRTLAVQSRIEDRFVSYEVVVIISFLAFL